MKPLIIGTIAGIALIGGTTRSYANPDLARGHATGHEAVRSVRHDWKSGAHHTVIPKALGQFSGLGPVPANFGRLTPEARLAYLVARHKIDPVRFDHFHPRLGPLLGLDDRLRAAQSQECRTMMGILPDSAHTRYLEYRRSLNPARFDIYHPTIGALLVENTKLRSGVNCPVPAALPPASGIGLQTLAPGNPSAGPDAAGGPGGGGTTVKTVPEPATLTLLLLGSAAAGLPRLARRFRKVSA